MRKKSISNLAQLAKIRLEKIGNNNSRKCVNLAIHRHYISSKLISEKEEREAEEFYLKVKNLMQVNPDCSNPLFVLMDKNFFESLNETDRQKYILKLAKKFRDCKKRYLLEFEKESV